MGREKGKDINTSEMMDKGAVEGTEGEKLPEFLADGGACTVPAKQTLPEVI